jgi:hypothetical protein
VPCLYIKYWPEDGSLEPKNVASYVLMTIYVLLTEQIALSQCTILRKTEPISDAISGITAKFTISFTSPYNVNKLIHVN